MNATDVFEKQLSEIEKTTPLNWAHSGMRQTFLKDLRREVQHVGGSFRTSRGSRISNLEDYVSAMFERGGYLRTRPSTKEKYMPVFPVRDETSKNSHKKLTEQSLRKAFDLHGIVFRPGMQEKVIDILSKAFIPVDGPNGLTFHQIADYDIGFLWSKEGIGIDSLTNLVDGFIDKEATKISQLSHRASLRQNATSMLPSGSKQSEIEKLTNELADFEKRSLRTNKQLPTINRNQIEDEFGKFAELNGQDRGAARNMARIAVESLENFQSLSTELQKIEIPNAVEEYKF